GGALRANRPRSGARPRLSAVVLLFAPCRGDARAAPGRRPLGCPPRRPALHVPLRAARAARADRPRLPQRGAAPGGDYGRGPVAPPPRRDGPVAARSRGAL